ncbi:MAG: hypothetical protein IJD80_05910, partial [Oscillospiraceae bacterium]|nr:hypothetical protein [Oscillospiraceae bacterium]
FEDQKLKDAAQSIVDVVEINNVEIDLGDELKWHGGREFSLEHAGDFDVVIDLTSDANYSIILATVIANNRADKAPFVEAVNKYIADGSIAELKALIDATRINELIAAMKAANGKSFSAMVDKMGYTGIDKAALVELEGKYSFVLDTLYKLLIKLDVTGTTTKLGSFASANYGEYEIAKKAFNVTGKLTVKLFSNEPVIVKVTPQVIDGINYGFTLDETKGILVVDTEINGITVDELKQVVTYTTLFADTKNLIVEDEYLVENEDSEKVLVNGAKFTITAENDYGKATREYTLIVLGDTNSNGIIESGDAYRIFRTFMYEHGEAEKLDREMTENEILAGNTNWDDEGELDSGDCVKILSKWFKETDDSATYKTSLKNQIISVII